MYLFISPKSLFISFYTKALKKPQLPPHSVRHLLSYFILYEGFEWATAPPCKASFGSREETEIAFPFTLLAQLNPFASAENKETCSPPLKHFLRSCWWLYFAWMNTHQQTKRKSDSVFFRKLQITCCQSLLRVSLIYNLLRWCWSPVCLSSSPRVLSKSVIWEESDPEGQEKIGSRGCVDSAWTIVTGANKTPRGCSSGSWRMLPLLLVRPTRETLLL